MSEAKSAHVAHQNIGPINSRRLATPGPAAWTRRLDPAAADKYLVVTVDCHVNEPNDVYQLGALTRSTSPGPPTWSWTTRAGT